MTDLKTQTDALRADARTWDTAAADLADPTAAIGSLRLNGGADVMMYGARLGIDKTYNDARARLEELLGQAAEYFGELADTLLTVARAYDTREEEQVAEFRRYEREVEGR